RHSRGARRGKGLRRPARAPARALPNHEPRGALGARPERHAPRRARRANRREPRCVMAWEVTADPVRFDEAASWFLARVVISDVDAQRLDAEARMRSFWVGAGLQLKQIQRVFDEINRAIDSGEPFEEWRKRVRSELTNDAHAETVFRNAVQRAYNAGRWRQMRESERWRPFGLVDAVLDLATTDYCKTVDGTLLPLDHPWWRTHYFPAHHRC